ncbi:MAG TPA: class F sortase [Dehalococcoidia bacterium]|jgi:LPXTG-site transpeptidase (sortase) family protein|nr:class F sortase [Dehalococcoidia bacterium]
MVFDPAKLIRSRFFLGGAAVVAVLAVAGAVAWASGGDDGDPETSITEPTASPSPTLEPSPEPTLIPQPTPIPVVPGALASDRVVISKAKVDAPVTLREVPAGGGTLPSPAGPDDVVFYDFTNFPGLGGYPGSGGRIVLSGHVDYGGGPCKNGRVPPPCTAVFWDLTDLKAGDEIEIHLSNGVHRYRVTDSENIGPAEQEKWDQVWNTTPNETIALITCGGDFNRQTHEYDSRHVVYGERIEG